MIVAAANAEENVVAARLDRMAQTLYKISRNQNPSWPRRHAFRLRPSTVIVQE